MIFHGDNAELDNLASLSADEAEKRLRSYNNVYCNKADLEELSEPSFYIERIKTAPVNEDQEIDSQRIVIEETDEGSIICYIG